MMSQSNVRMKEGARETIQGTYIAKELNSQSYWGHLAKKVAQVRQNLKSGWNVVWLQRDKNIV